MTSTRTSGSRNSARIIWQASSTATAIRTSTRFATSPIKGKLYNGKPVSAVTSHGPTIQDITAYAHGIVGRGVLLDIPRLRGVKWLEPGEAVTTVELEAAEKAQGVRLGEGDIFVFRTGHHRRRLELGPWNNGYDGEGKAGLHVETILLLHERKVAAFFPDGDGETVPSNVRGNRLSNPCLANCRHGDGLRRQSAIRRIGQSLRSRKTLGIPGGGRSAPLAGRNGLAVQSHRHFLSRTNAL